MLHNVSVSLVVNENRTSKQCHKCLDEPAGKSYDTAYFVRKKSSEEVRDWGERGEGVGDGI